jgi:hypothetical protein
VIPLSSFIAKDVRCPYYKKEDGVKICCEGFEENSSIHMIFPSAKKRRLYQLQRCCIDYKKCPIVKINDERWGINDGRE